MKLSISAVYNAANEHVDRYMMTMFNKIPFLLRFPPYCLTKFVKLL